MKIQFCGTEMTNFDAKILIFKPAISNFGSPRLAALNMSSATTRFMLGSKFHIGVHSEVSKTVVCSDKVCILSYE